MYSSLFKLFTFFDVPLSINSTLSGFNVYKDSNIYEKFKFKSLDSVILITFLKSYQTLKSMSSKSSKSHAPKLAAFKIEEWKGKSISMPWYTQYPTIRPKI